MKYNYLLDLLKRFYRIIPIKYRKGHKYMEEYDRIYSFLKVSEKWSEKEIKSYQLEELKKLLNYAYQYVPYYRKLFDDIDLQITDDFTINDFMRIPYLDKELVQKNSNLLISTQYDKKEIVCHQSGGSSGKPGTYYFEKIICDAREHAYVQHLYDRIGYDPSEAKVCIRDVLFGKIYPKDNFFWRKVYGYNIWYFSPRYMNDMNLHYYYLKLKSINPKWIIGFPSGIYSLARYIIQNSLESLISLKGIMFISENISSEKLDIIKEAFKNTKILSVYGHTEHGCIAATCNQSFNYHIQQEYGFTEFLRVDNSNLSEIVTTGFTNYVMPLIRYRTGDFVKLSSDECKCGRKGNYIEYIDGRADDALVASDGELFRSSLFDMFSKDVNLLKDVIKYQFVQDYPGECVMKLVVNENMTKDGIENIEATVNHFAGSTLKVSIEVVESLSLTIRGKERMIIRNFHCKD